MFTDEQRLWRRVLAQAGRDAIIDRTEAHYLKYGKKWHYDWSKSRDCKIVCSLADVDYDCVTQAFEDIYKSENNQELKQLLKELTKGE